MKYFLVMLLAAVPFTKPKFDIPIEVHQYNIDPISVLLLTWVGCLLPVPFILIFFDSKQRLSASLPSSASTPGGL